MECNINQNTDTSKDIIQDDSHLLQNASTSISNNNSMTVEGNIYKVVNLMIAMPTKLDVRAHTVCCMLQTLKSMGTDKLNLTYNVADSKDSSNVKKVEYRIVLNLRYEILPGKSNIDQARSMLITKWYDESKDGDLFMFLDSDQTWQPSDIYQLVQMLYNPAKPCHVACGGYSRSNNTLILGPENYVDFINNKNDKLVYGATGFMMFERKICTKVYNQIIKEHPDKPKARFYIDERYPAVIPFFKQRLLSKDNGIAKNDNEWLSEDYSFCYLVRMVGGTIRGFISPSIGHVVPFTAYVDLEKDIKHKNEQIARHILKKDPNFKGDLEPIKFMKKPSTAGTGSPGSTNQSQSNQQEKKLNITWGDKSIVYFTGPSIEPWGPKSLYTGLGGSETAVLQLSKYWSRMGYEVIIYGNFTEETLNKKFLEYKHEINTDDNFNSNSEINMRDWNNVKFMPFNLINVNDIFNILILWRAPHMANQFKNYNRLLVDQHDVPRANAIVPQFYQNITKYMVKSDYHRQLFLDHVNQLIELNKNNENLDKVKEMYKDSLISSDNNSLNNTDNLSNKYSIIPNGGAYSISHTDDRLMTYSEIEEIKKANYNKLIYCSSYDRGLLYMLRYGWPIINEQYPEAELHIYYGWDYFDKFMELSKQRNDTAGYEYRRKFKDEMLELINKYDNVHEHGRIGKEELKNIKLHSNIHYYTGEFTEIDCISTRESASVGCVPVVNNLAAFTDDRKDYMIKIDPIYSDSDNMSTDSTSKHTLEETIEASKSQASQERYAQTVVDLLKNKEKLNDYRFLFYKSSNLNSERWENIAKEWAKEF